jgi:hypothetical protein
MSIAELNTVIKNLNNKFLQLNLPETLGQVPYRDRVRWRRYQAFLAPMLLFTNSNIFLKD